MFSLLALKKPVVCFVGTDAGALRSPRFNETFSVAVNERSSAACRGVAGATKGVGSIGNA